LTDTGVRGHPTRLAPRRAVVAAVAAAALAGTWAACGPEGERKLAARAGGHRAGSVERFVSRPDLRPPAIDVDARRGGAFRGLVFVTPRPAPSEQAGPLLFDDAGQLAWFRPLPGGRLAVDVRAQRYRGRSVLTWGERPVDAHDEAESVIADSHYRVLARVRAGAGVGTDLHEFRILPGDRALVLGWRSVPWDLRPIGGPRRGRALEGVVQIVSIPTGRVLLDWHSLDHVRIRESYAPILGGTSDYFHINSVAPDADGNLLVSARHTSAIYKIDARTGRVIWRLGGKRSSFTLGPGARFAFQHDAQRQSDGTISLFDNAAIEHGSPERSRALRLRLDPGRRTARLVGEYRRPTAVLSTSQGNTQVLPNGNVFVGWGSQPYVSEFTAGGRLVFDARLPSRGHQSYRAYRARWVGRPEERPAVAVRGVGGRTRAYVSWNGATGVARWRVLAGSSPDQLEAVGVAERMGFETVIGLPHRDRYVAVEATDGSGATMGASLPIRAR
jgi:outer membrane protein assembly factor BamB